MTDRITPPGSADDELNPRGFSDNADGAEEQDQQAFKRLTKDEAQALRAKHPPLSPWRVVAAQAVAGGVCAALAWGLTGRSGVAWSALYGAAAIVVPSALLARGIGGRAATNPGAAVFGFLLWEAVKIAVAVVMLALAARVVPDLSWPALLVAMIVCVKVNWLALLWRRKPAQVKKR
jgi:ATP synthase protein I